MNTPVLVAEHLGKRFPILGGFWRRVIGYVDAVQDVSCSLKAGQILGLVGESGCGKSTLAKLLVGLLEPTEGEIRFYGEPLVSLKSRALRSSRRKIQMIFQNPTHSLDPRMSVEETLSEPLLVHRMVSDKSSLRKRVERLLEQVQLTSAYRKRLPHQLSGGERQRIGIARALSVEPQVLICDEPIASLDVSVGAKILELLKGLCLKRAMAMILISHDLGAVACVCEEVAVMQEGRLLEVGPTESLLRHPKHPYTALLIQSSTLEEL